MLEDFGSYSVIVREVPVVLDSFDVEPIVFEIVEKILQNKRDVTFEKLDWLYHSIACRAAIKANDKSAKIELEELVKQLDSNASLRHCPHGRPIYIQITKKELEKQFGRIV
jgi:DNA mismatch repair protein MutL